MRKAAKAPLSRASILRELRERDAELKRFSVRRIGLFGSFASGKPTRRSDIDFIVEFAEPTYENFCNLVDYLEALFGRKVEVLTPIALQTMRVPEVAESIHESVVYA